MLWNSHGLNWPYSFEQQRQKTGDLDMLDWLRAMFGFQRDNVRNQREHLILLLANSHIRLHPKPKPFNLLDDWAVDSVMKNLFKNYKSWCKCLGRKHSLRLPQGQQEIQQRKLIIWGEASNVRFMPECLCYIFHNVSTLSMCSIISQCYNCFSLGWPMRNDGEFFKSTSDLAQVITS